MKPTLWLALALTVGCVATPHSTDTPAVGRTSLVSECRPDFPDRAGWLGADAAYSVPLEPGRSLWLFGDTFVARTSGASRADATLVRNSIGVSICDPADGWRIDYPWSNQDGDDPRAFFDSKTEETWCYAVKEHLEFSRGEQLLVTYTCNSINLDEQITNPRIYRPQAVVVDLGSHRDN